MPVDAAQARFPEGPRNRMQRRGGLRCWHDEETVNAQEARPSTNERRETADFATFFEAEYPVLIRMTYLLTGDQAEAEDLAEEAMTSALERWSRVSTMESPGGYVYRTVLNLNHNRLRGLRTRLRRLPLVPRSADPSDVIDAQTSVRSALASLPVGQRQAVVLVEWLGYTSEEAAGILGIEAASVRSRIHRAKQSLRALLGDADA
jgi:RNA polymerase sigma factor (sigma-70 family)